MKTDRRSFLKGTVFSVGTGALTASGCQNPPSDERDATSPSEVRASGGVEAPHEELVETTIDALQRAMEAGEESAVSLVEKYTARVEALDRDERGPRLRSVLEINPDARELAETLDRERADGASRGPLHGIPVVLKDNISTADRMQTTAGSLALMDKRPGKDASVAQGLREAGALILGKTNLSEWANFRSTRSSSGWSGRGGQCKNPYVLDRNPCGSSSGSGSATSANLAAVSLGTETDGSVVCPSNANGLVGVKPTVGLVSRTGIIPIAHSQDTAGPMTRTVRDAALVLAAIAAPPDEKDPATQFPEAASLADELRTLALDAASLQGARIGVARRFFGFHADVDKVLESSLEAVRDAGAELIDPIDYPAHPELGDAEFTVLLYEFKTDLEAYLQGLGELSIRTLEDLIAFNEQNRESEMPFFGQEILERAAPLGDLKAPEYLQALRTCRRLSRAEGIDAVMDSHRLDAIVAPTGGPAWVTDLVNGDHFSGGSSQPAAISGYPNITVPAGFVQGLPIGLSWFGRAWSDARLIGYAFAFEQATKVRRAPEFRPTLA